MVRTTVKRAADCRALTPELIKVFDAGALFREWCSAVPSLNIKDLDAAVQAEGNVCSFTDRVGG